MPQQRKGFRYLRLLVAFFFGILAGSIIMTFLFGEKLESLYLERETLYYEHNRKIKKIQLLQQDLDKHAEQDARRQQSAEYIEQIQVEIDSSEKFNQDKIKTEVESILKPFLNKSVHWVSNDPAVLDTMLKNRVVKLPGKNTSPLQLQLKYLAFINSELKVWVIARESSDKDVSLDTQ
ncbi:hypothetical protein [Salinithrix halophila]|uniref:Sporulation protein n=1 Tax=Salinithrix halophila TaxID=1485204 RepID=A0ABV8JA77_9BACL